MLLLRKNYKITPCTVYNIQKYAYWRSKGESIHCSSRDKIKRYWSMYRVSYYSTYHSRLGIGII